VKRDIVGQDFEKTVPGPIPSIKTGTTLTQAYKVAAPTPLERPKSIILGSSFFPVNIFTRFSNQFTRATKGTKRKT